MSTGRSEPGGREAAPDVKGTAAARRYDSFLVRVWGDPTRAVLLRAEAQHVQTGLVESATNVARSWVVRAIATLLGDERDEPADDPPRADRIAR
jgi:hypothetical protein